MAKMSKESKQRLQQLFRGGQFAIRWGFIPLVLYLGQCGGGGERGRGVVTLLWG
uniref:Mitochondrial import receptor subunit TOM7 homolog n=1 Tax=Monodelphis domestica TaxID=13616 RepID=F7FLN7_MONDO